MNADNLHDLSTRKIINQGLTGEFIFDARHLTVREWWNWKVRHKGDPRVHYHPVKIKFYDVAAGIHRALGEEEQKGEWIPDDSLGIPGYHYNPPPENVIGADGEPKWMPGDPDDGPIVNPLQ